MTTIWTFSTTICGIIAGWSLNEFGQWLRTKRDEKKTHKKVLFYLLEIRNSFRQFSNQDYLELINEKLKNHLCDELTDQEGIALLEQTTKKILTLFLKSSVLNNLSDLEESYTICINELALVDPITAYRLKGNNKIVSFFEISDSILTDFTMQSNEQDLREFHFREIMESFKPDIIHSSILELEREILNICSAISLRTKYNAKKIIKEQNEGINNAEISEKFNRILDEAIVQIKSNFL